MYPESLPKTVAEVEKMIGKLSPAARIVLSCNLDSGSTVVHWMIEQNPSALDRLFDRLPFADRPLAARIKDKNGIPAIYCALQSHSTGLKKLLAQLSKEELRDVLLEEVEALDGTILYAVTQQLVDEEDIYVPSILKLLLEKLRPEDRLAVLQIPSRFYRNVLFAALHSASKVTTLLESLSEEDKLTLLFGGAPRCGALHVFGQTIHNPTILKIILDQLPKHRPFETILTGGGFSNTLRKAKGRPNSVSRPNGNYESYMSLLSFLLGHDEQMWTAYHLLDEKMGVITEANARLKFKWVERLKDIIKLKDCELPRPLKTSFFSSPPPFVIAMNHLSLAEQQLVAAIILEERGLAYSPPAERAALDFRA